MRFCFFWIVVQLGGGGSVAGQAEGEYIWGGVARRNLGLPITHLG